MAMKDTSRPVDSPTRWLWATSIRMDIWTWPLPPRRSGRLPSSSATAGGAGAGITPTRGGAGRGGGGGAATVYLKDGGGRFAKGQELGGFQGPVAAVAADFDRDGRVDLAVADTLLSTVLVPRGGGRGGRG